ncbi:unnamed protein product [Brassica oleracea var. botrytis]|uniref:Uncharacterized protein n=2 Tax=Brassica oleracea TaxID=3712 RepID=A0A0D3CP36_BRAOL|nr:unnamed protein product [Brassica oleracea]
MINIEVLGKDEEELFLQLVLLCDQRWCDDRFPCSRLDSDECCHVGWDLAVAALLFFAGSNFYRLQKPGGRVFARALSLTTVALGNYLSTLLVTVVTKVTTTGGRPGWIADNLTRGHLDYYYYWLLAVFEFLEFLRLPLDC